MTAAERVKEAEMDITNYLPSLGAAITAKNVERAAEVQEFLSERLRVIEAVKDTKAIRQIRGQLMDMGYQIRQVRKAQS